MLHENQFTSSESFTRLENDVTALQALRQPAFQKIFSLERANSSSFLTLEWVEGPVLLDLLRTRRSLPSAGRSICSDRSRRPSTNSPRRN